MNNIVYKDYGGEDEGNKKLDRPGSMTKSPKNNNDL